MTQKWAMRHTVEHDDGWIEQLDPQNFTPPQVDNNFPGQENDLFSKQIDQEGSSRRSHVLKTGETESLQAAWRSYQFVALSPGGWEAGKRRKRHWVSEL